MAQQGRLARAPRSRQHDGGKSAGGTEQLRCEQSVNDQHMSILNLYFRILNTMLPKFELLKRPLRRLLQQRFLVWPCRERRANLRKLAAHLVVDHGLRG